MKYSNEEIKKSIVDFLSIEGNEYFRNLKDEHGTCWVREDVDGWSTTNWVNEGRQIRNHIIDKYPDIVEELGDYEDFEEYIYTIVEEIFE